MRSAAGGRGGPENTQHKERQHEHVSVTDGIIFFGPVRKVDKVESGAHVSLPFMAAILPEKEKPPGEHCEGIFKANQVIES